MTPRPAALERSQSSGEELANSLSHGVGLVAALVAAPFLIRSVLSTGDGLAIIGASVFALSVVVLYLSSTVYHALPRGRAKHVLRVIDHGAIFLLIAGTYTPFTLGPLRGIWGWSLSIVIWALALMGVLLKAARGVRHPRLSMILYIGMGWLLVIAVRPMWRSVPLPGLVWLVAGGLSYMVGVGFFAAKRLRYAHFVWHVFVLLGTACSFMAIRYYTS